MEKYGNGDAQPNADPLDQQKQSQKLKYKPVIKHAVC
jgi:hypothetical protein